MNYISTLTIHSVTLVTMDTYKNLSFLADALIMEAETCRARGINDVAFMDPNKVNKNSCKGIDGNPHDVMKHVTQIFLNCEAYS